MARTPAPQQPARRRGLRRRRKADDGSPGTLAQLKQSVALTRRHDPRAIPLALVIALVVIGVFVGIGLAVGHLVLLAIGGVLVGFLAGFNWFGWRAQRAVYAEVEDQRGVALEVIRRMRGDWKITEAVQFTRNQDFVHRVVGRPGVVLVAEGRPQAARELLRTEARRIRRVAPDVPLREIVIGTGEQDVPLLKLRPQLARMKRVLKPDEVRSLDVKLKAVAGTQLPLPKGPMPTRMQRGKIR